MLKNSIVILGSTGSIGKNTLSVIAQHPDKYEIYALSAHSNIESLFTQCEQFQPKIAVVYQEEKAALLAVKLQNNGLSHIQVKTGNAGLCEIVSEDNVDIVMSAIVGAAGLLPMLYAVNAAKKVLIANKEPLVMMGNELMEKAKQTGAVILPVDSEHNAIFQCLPNGRVNDQVRKLHLTASGGPFFTKQWDDLKEVTPEQACAHPNWSMGRKISVDSATLMNKGLELIEASVLFGLPANEIDVIIHPQSIVHSIVEYIDGSFLAQMGSPDMRIPIAYALAWPERINSGAKTLNFFDMPSLDFHRVKSKQWPCLDLARQASLCSGMAPTILNAANEVAVQAFLDNKIGFTDISIIVEKALSTISSSEVITVENVLHFDKKTRNYVQSALSLSFVE